MTTRREPRNGRGRGRERSGVGALALVLGLFAAWEVLARTGAISSLFFPPPSTVLRVLGGMITDGRLPAALGATVRRLFLGLVLGGIPALLIGLAMGMSRRLRHLIDPVIACLHPMPKIALLPLFMILLGLGEAPRVFIAALAAFFPVLINSMAGVLQIRPIHLEVAENYGAGPVRTIARVVLPGSLPFVLAGVRLAFNSCLVVTIAVELVSARIGIGAMIWAAWETMRTEEMYAALAVTALLGVLLNETLRRFSRFLAPWQIAG